MGSSTRKAAKASRSKSSKKAAARKSSTRVTKTKASKSAKKAASKDTSRRAATSSKRAATSKPKTVVRKTQGRSKPVSSDIEVDAEVLEFIAAIDEYKNDHGRPFPSWSEVLFVLKSLGYSKR